MISSDTPPPRRTYSARPINADPQIEVLYDGACPLCSREIGMLRRLDRKSRIRFTDIAHKDFDPGAYGKDRRALMSQMHARLAGGQWVTGVEAFRRMYSAIGFSLPARLSRLPGVTHALEFGYRVFARNRLRLTGRSAECGACAR